MSRNELLAVMASNLYDHDKSYNTNQAINEAVDLSEKLLLEIENRERRRPATTVPTIWNTK